MAHLAVAVAVHDWADRTIDGKFLPIDAKARELGIEIREVSALKEGIIGEANTYKKKVRSFLTKHTSRKMITWHNMGSAKCRLLGLSEELVNILVELHLSDVSYREKFFRPDLSGVKDVEIEVVLSGFGADLDSELPGREDTHIDGSHQILAMEVGVLTTELKSFIPYQGMNS